MRGFAVGIPTLSRYDLLQNCLDSVFAGSARPTATFVIDNGSFAGRLHGESIIEYSYGKNLGVAASWNRLFSIAEGFSLPVFILNDDIELGRNTLERMLASDADFVSVAGAGINAFSCFLLRRAAYDLVGPFDETFYPAYVEDSDYSYRMMLADVRCEAVECDGFTHHGSATKMAGDAAFRAWIESRWGENHAYYRRKWGGPVGGEVWKVPFNGKAVQT